MVRIATKRTPQLLAGCFALGGLVVQAQAAVFLWDGGSAVNSNWSTAENWNPDGAPVSGAGADIQLAGVARLDSAVGAAFTLNSLAYNSGAGAFTLSGSTLTFSNAVAADVVVVKLGVTNTQSVANNLLVSGSNTKTFKANASALVLNGSLGIASGGGTPSLKFTSDDNSAAHTLTVNGNITGSYGQFQIDVGTAVNPQFVTVLNGNNSFTAQFLLFSGTVKVGHSNALGSGTGGAPDVQFAAGTTGRTMKLLTIAPVTVSRNIFIQGAAGAGLQSSTIGGETADASVFSGDIILGSNSTGKGAQPLTVTAATNGTVTFSGNLLQPTSPFAGSEANAALTKTGDGTVILAGANNTYIGTTTVSAGTLRVNGTLTAGGGAVTVNANATLGGTGTINRPVLIKSSGTLSPGNSVGSLTVGGLTLADAAILNFEFNATANDMVNITTGGNLTLWGGGFNLYQEGTTLAYSLPTGTNSATYHLIHYSGTYTGDIDNFAVLNPQPGLRYTFADNSVDQTIDLTIDRPDASAGTLTTGPLTLESNAILNFQLGSPWQYNGANLPSYNDLVRVNGDLTLAGQVYVNRLPGFRFTYGTHTLMTYTGTLTNNAPNLAELPDGYTGAIVIDPANKAVNLAVRAEMVRGMNIPTPGRFGFYPDAAYFNTFKQTWGAAAVRIRVDSLNIARDRGVSNSWAIFQEALNAVANAVINARQAGLKVIVTLNNVPNTDLDRFSDAFWTSPDLQATLVQAWHDIAVAMLPYRDCVYGYDLYNEPTQTSYPSAPPANWRPLAIQIIKEIRQVEIDNNQPNPNWIIYEPGYWNDTLPYADLQPLSDEKVIYSIHFYDAYHYTHQGVWNNATYDPTGYASNPADNPVDYPGEANGQYWDKTYMDGGDPTGLALVDQFQSRYLVPVFVGEFSAVRWAPGAAAWLADVSDLLNQRRWSWCYHAYREWYGWNLEMDATFYREGDPNYPQLLPAPPFTDRGTAIHDAMTVVLP
ncbi:MAG: cellulase family glycosylhydrolase [Phycisphaerales bacterium]